MPTPRRRNPVAYLRRIKRLIQAAVLPKQAIHSDDLCDLCDNSATTYLLRP